MSVRSHIAGRVRAMAGFLTIAALIAPGCGTRVRDSGAAALPAPVGSVGLPAESAPSGSSSGDPEAAMNKQPGPQSAKGPVGTSVPADPKATASTGSSAPSGAKPAGGTVGSRPPEATGHPVVPPPTHEASPRSPLTLASVGTYSGPAGVVTVPVLQGAQLWVKSINQRGGLNGHAVRLVVFDDGGDTARHRAQVQEAIERRQAVAFLADGEGLTGAGSVDYITSKRVPVIGSDSGGQWFHESPMYFPQVPHGASATDQSLYSAASVSIPVGKTKLGTIVCVEVQACKDADRRWSEAAEPLGFDYVFRTQASIAQPDFTASCLSAKNAGVEVFLLLMDANSTARIATSCGRQGFHPMYFQGGPGAWDKQAKDPNLDELWSSTPTFPWFQSGTAATDEFQRALRDYGSNLEPNGALTLGWVAGKVLERAGADLPEPGTSEGILDGLWTIKGDRLDGLAASPLTFIRDRVTAAQICWFNIKVLDGAWSSIDGFQTHCSEGAAGAK